MDEYLQQKLQHLKLRHNYRKLVTSENNGVMLRRAGREYISFCSNDYLGVIAGGAANSGHKNDTMYNKGAGASRLVSGNHALYAELEASLAEAKQKQTALVFGSGYLANIGAITALVGASDLILLDKLSHACMIDGARLSGAKMLRFAHNDMVHLEALLLKNRKAYRHCIVASETVFSMDGDLAPMADLRRLCDTHQAWLLVDDAHGFGLPHVQAHLGDVVIGTFSKAIGTYGGYVAGSSVLCEYLVNTARSFIFTTALPEAICADSLHNIRLIASEPWRAQRVLDYEKQITSALGLKTQQSPIIPLIIGGNEACLLAHQQLQKAGIMLSAIRPPTVAIGTSRLRISLNAAHTQVHIDALLAGLRNLKPNGLR